MTAIMRAPRRATAGHARRHHPSRRHHGASDAVRRARTARRVALILGLLPLACGVMLGSAVAERAPAVSTVSADEAALSGRDIVIATRDDLARGLAEVRVPTVTTVTRASGADQLLAVAPGASSAAIAAQVGVETTALIIARSDGSQLRVDLPGLIAAAFAPDGSWLAAIDGRGALWRVDAAGGSARQMAAGPFIGRPVAESAGSVLALRVPSVEAPYRSQLLRVAPDGSATPLTAETLVYGVQPLADGSLAVIAHRSTGTVALRVAGGRATVMADLGPDAVNVAVDRSGSLIAWERAGEAFVQRLSAGNPQRIAAGTHPRFSADGRALLVDVPTGTQLIQADGPPIGSFSTQLDFAGCAVECAP